MQVYLRTFLFIVTSLITNEISVFYDKKEKKILTGWSIFSALLTENVQREAQFAAVISWSSTVL